MQFKILNFDFFLNEMFAKFAKYFIAKKEYEVSLLILSGKNLFSNKLIKMVRIRK